MRNAHVDVIHDDAQLVGRRALRLAFLGRTQENEILDLLIRHFARAENRVVEFRGCAQRNAESDGRHSGRWTRACRRGTRSA